MVTEPNQRRISSALTRVASGFSTFILAVILSTHFNQLGPNISPGDSQLLPLVVAKMEIPAGTRIIAEQLTVAQFPRNVAIEGAFRKIDNNLLERVTLARIMPREPITESRLAPIGLPAGLSLVIPEGYRAMTVKVDEVVGVSGFIMPGTLVDVVVVVEPSDGSGETDWVFKIVLVNIKVLASGQNIVKPRNEKEAVRVKAVTLQVTPEQAEKLALASSEGKLQLVIRNSIDHADEITRRK